MEMRLHLCSITVENVSIFPFVDQERRAFVDSFLFFYLLLVIEIRIQTTEFRLVATGFVFEAYVLQLSPLVSCFS